MTAITVPALSEAKQALLAKLLRERRQAAVNDGPRPRIDRGRAPLTSAQRSLWLFNEMEGSGSSFNVGGGLRLRGTLDPAALEAALRTVIARHEILRTIFAKDEDGPHQRILDDQDIPLSREDIAAGGGDALAAAQARIAAELERPFDLAAGPLLRALLLRLGADDHVFYVVVHHIVFDGWSMNILFAELSQAYTALSTGGTPALPPLSVQFGDVAVWEAGPEREQALAEQLGYWVRRLENVPHTLTLPSDFPRSRQRSLKGGQVPVAVPADLAARVQDLARRQGATPFQLLLAVYQLLLVRFSGQPDLVVGTSAANRRRPELEPLIGFFVNNLAIRATHIRGQNFTDWLDSVRLSVTEAFRHQDVPFDRIVTALGVERAPDRMPLVQVRFAYADLPSLSTNPPGLHCTMMEAGDAGLNVKSDLLLSLWPAEDGIRGMLQYSLDLFRPETASRLAERFVTLLANVCAAPERPMEEISHIGAAESAALQALTGRTIDHGPVLSVPAMMHAQMIAAPDAPALAFEGMVYSRRELWGRACALRAQLRANGIGTGDRVVLCTGRSAEFILGLAAVLALGATYVPLDPDSPPDRLAALAAQAGAKLVLLAPGTGASAAAFSIPSLIIDREALAPLPPSAAELEEVDPGQAAYLIYTSGSTGVPKGVLVSHRSLFNYVRGVGAVLDLPAGAEHLALSTITADLGNTSIFGALCGGGCLRLVPEPATLDAELLGRLLAERPIDCLKIVPSHFDALLRVGEPARLMPRLCIVFGGEPLTPALVRRVRDVAPDLRIINHYGPTETTIGVLTNRLEGAADATGTIPLGRPLPNVRAHVLDGEMRPAALGEVGELYLAGSCLALGYAEAPALTAERFVPDPFSTSPGARMYRTGDQVRHATDGLIEFLGRRDHQVKIRGHRVELGEVEAALKGLALVRDCAVTTPSGASIDTELAAFVVPAEGADVDSLRRALRAILPEHMVPTAFHLLDALPLTPNGKVDRKRLVVPAAAEAPAPLAAPSVDGGLKDTVRAVWSKVLKRPQIGDDEVFFEIGGHSLVATLAVFQLRKSVAPWLTVRDLFDNPTVAQLAQLIAARRAPAAEAEMIVPRPRPDRIPLTFSQERLWFVEQMNTGSAAYNVPLGIRLRGTLDATALRHSLSAVVERHESLRTTFHGIGGTPVQIIHPSATVPVTETDLSELPAEAQEQGVAAAVRDEVVRPFDLEHGPLIRAHLLRLGREHHVLLLTMHHIVSDGWSNEVLSRELTAFWTAFQTGTAVEVAQLPIQYADYALWERRSFEAGGFERQIAYWRRRLAGAPERLAIPTDAVPGAAESMAGRTEQLRIPLPVIEKLRRLCAEEGTTLFVALQAVFKLLLSRYAQTDDVVIGTTHANRSRPETEPLIGFFVNQVPLRTVFQREETFRALIRREAKAVADDFAHHDLPFNLLVSSVARERRLNVSPIFQILFVLQNVPRREFTLPGLTLEGIEFDVAESKFDFSLFLLESDDTMRGALIYRANLFSETTMRRMAGRFVTLLAAAAQSPESSIESLDMISDTERAEAAQAQTRIASDNLSKLRAVRRRTVSTESRDLVTSAPMDAERGFPLLVQPVQPGIDLTGWARENRAFIEQSMLRYGAVLFRGFESGPAKVDLEAFAAAVSDKLISEYGDLPRESESGRVYKSTPYPSDQAILIHNESSHLHRWPTKIFFSCVIPATKGGETPIVDCRQLYKALDPAIIEKFARKKLTYVRNYIEGVDVSWEHFFRTDDRSQVEAYCRENDIAWEWSPNGTLTTRVTCEAVRPHPKTGEMVFFNQICLHHISCVEPSTRESLLRLYGESGLPRNVYYGDGEPIEDEVITEVRRKVDELAAAFPWRKGDVIALDNVLCAHARNPFEGERKIIVAIGDICDDRTLT